MNCAAHLPMELCGLVWTYVVGRFASRVFVAVDSINVRMYVSGSFRVVLSHLSEIGIVVVPLIS